MQFLGSITLGIFGVAGKFMCIGLAMVPLKSFDSYLTNDS